jgi:hypothetical protein
VIRRLAVHESVYEVAACAKGSKVLVKLGDFWSLVSRLRLELGPRIRLDLILVLAHSFGELGLDLLLVLTHWAGMDGLACPDHNDVIVVLQDTWMHKITTRRRRMRRSLCTMMMDAESVRTKRSEVAGKNKAI